MNDQSKQSTPSPETKQPPETNANKTNIDNNSRNIATSILKIFLTMVFAFAIALAALQFMHIEKSSGEKFDQLNQKDIELQQLIDQQNEKISKNQDALISLEQKIGDNSKVWIFPKVESLIWNANIMLTLNKNVATTVTLLNKADAYLHQLNDPKLIHIRNILAKDITTLKALPKIDITGIYLHIQALNDQIDKAPLIIADKLPSDRNPTKEIMTKTEQSVWKNVLQNSLNTLKSILIIRHREQPVQPLLTIQQHNLLKMSLRMFLSQAQSALLEHNDQIYQSALQQSKQTIQKYFLQSDTTTKFILTELDSLLKVTIAPKLPNIDDVIAEIKTLNKEMTP